MGVTLTLIAGDNEAAQGRYDLITGSVFTKSEQLVLAGSFERLRALIRQAPILTSSIQLTIEGSSAEVKKTGQDIIDKDLDLYRARFLAIINLAEKELITNSY